MKKTILICVCAIFIISIFFGLFSFKKDDMFDLSFYYHTDDGDTYEIKPCYTGADNSFCIFTPDISNGWLSADFEGASFIKINNTYYRPGKDISVTDSDLSEKITVSVCNLF